MFPFHITGLKQLTSQFEQFQTAMKEINGKLCGLRFDPSDSGQVQAAIQKTEQAVDERLSEFPDNPLVQQFATGTKEKIKAEILKRASEARRRLTVNGIPFDPLDASALLGSTPVTLSKGWSRAPRRKGRTI